jgi:hypothetical protein
MMSVDYFVAGGRKNTQRKWTRQRLKRLGKNTIRVSLAEGKGRAAETTEGSHDIGKGPQDNPA